MNRLIILASLFLSLFQAEAGAQPGWHSCAFFGKADAWDRHARIDMSLLPPIHGLKYRSCQVLCSKDTCYASRAVIAVRCPSDPVLLEWASRRAAWFANWCKTGQYDCEAAATIEVTSAADICNQYIRCIEQGFRQECTGDGDHNVPNEQFGFFLADCWRTEEYCTFQEETWYDMLSCGNTRQISYYTIDLASGKVLQLSDLVKEERWPELVELLLVSLHNEVGNPWLPENARTPIEPLALLKMADGCALLEEGLLIYYHPYTIGCGAEGEYTGVIPI